MKVTILMSRVSIELPIETNATSVAMSVVSPESRRSQTLENKTTHIPDIAEFPALAIASCTALEVLAVIFVLGAYGTIMTFIILSSDWV